MPSASGTSTTVTDWSPVNEIEEPPSWAGGCVKVGAPASGTAGVGERGWGSARGEAAGEPGETGRVGSGSRQDVGPGDGADVGAPHRMSSGMQNSVGADVRTAPIPVAASATQSAIAPSAPPRRARPRRAVRIVSRSSRSELRRLRHPRDGEDAAHRPEQHPDEEAAQVHADERVDRHGQRDDAVEDAVHGHEDGEDAEQHQHQRDDRRLQPLDAELHVDLAEVELAGEEQLDAGEHGQETADERALTAPRAEARPAAGSASRWSSARSIPWSRR